MEQFLFEGIGTHWKVLYFPIEGIKDPTKWKKKLEERILALVEKFDEHYSRFKQTSLVWQIARSRKTHHQISDEFVHILEIGKKLSQITHGRFNPAVGQILENLGYDAQYSFQEKKSPKAINLSWEVNNNTLITPKPVLLDIGGWGKGFLIDLIAELLRKNKIMHYLVDGGGDIFATNKPDNSPWKVALEHPLDDTMVFGMVELHYMAMASSGTSKRTFGNHHHLIDVDKQDSVSSYLGVHVQANTATLADGMATALFVSDLAEIDAMAKKMAVEYLLVANTLGTKKSAGFVGDIFQ